MNSCKYLRQSITFVSLLGLIWTYDPLRRLRYAMISGCRASGPESDSRHPTDQLVPLVRKIKAAQLPLVKGAGGNGIYRHSSSNQRTVISLLLICGLLAMAVGVTSARADKGPSFNITTRRDSDQVIAKAEHDKVTFSVHSPFGISNATIERVDERWPDVVVLRLHLQGLEHFSLSNDTMKLDASVSSQDGSFATLEGRQGRHST